MKKWVVIVLSAVLMMAGTSYASEFSSVNKAGDVTVRATSDSDPFKVGDNIVTFDITGSNGAMITDAEVSIYYFMPSMPSMNYSSKSELQGTKYAAVIKPTMPGAWKADIKVMNAEGNEHKVTISFDAK